MSRLSFALLLLFVVAAPGADHPNIVFIMADDLGWNNVSYHGGRARTPNIDALAKKGLTLKRY